MSLRTRSGTALILALAVASITQSAFGQLPVSRGRVLAPDALVVIDPAADWSETGQGPVDLPLVNKHPDLAWTPNSAPASETLMEKAKQVVFRGDVYCLEFAFKPVRMISVGGQNVWYLLYRVRYLGGDLQPVPEPDRFNNPIYGKPKSISADWVRFMPLFRLDTLALGKVYVDEVIPQALPAIANKERVGSRIYNSVEIQRLKLELSTETENNAVWGVATWRGVDPRTDFFTVQVQGLTNAQKLELDGTNLKYLQKTLVLHFSRPGDTIDELQDRIRFGIPALKDSERQKYILGQYGQQERLDYVWKYR